MQQTNPPDPDSIRRYLLGTSAPAEQELIELRLLADRTFYDEVSAAEDELLDEYLDGRLAGRERENFDDIFLAAPERQQKLRFALALRRRAAESARPSSADSVMVAEGAAAAGGAARGGFFGRLGPTARAACAAVIVLAATGAVLLAVRTSRPPHAPTPAAPVADDRAADSSRPRESPAPHAPPTRPDGRADAPAKTVAVTLTPGLTRGADGETRRVEITPDVGRVRLELLIASGDYPTYQATVRSVEGRAVCDLTGLAAESSGGAQAVFVEVPASSLAPDDYRVKLSGLREHGGDPEPLDSYFFRVLQP